MLEPLEQMFTSYWRYLAVRAACKLDLFDHVAAGIGSVPVLREAMSCDQKALENLVGALVHMGMLSSTDDRSHVTEYAQRLCAHHPRSLKYACLLWGGEHMDVWQQLDQSIRSGQGVFPVLYGKPFFSYLAVHPDRASEYHRAMSEYARVDYLDIGNVLDLSQEGTVLDVGGGNGALVDSLRVHYPEVSFSIFDIQDHRTVASQDLPFIQGDFFQGIPKGSSAFILSRVIHDQDDAEAELILRNCYAALPSGGHLYLVENDVALLGDGGHLLSLNMLAMCGSRERSLKEYLELLDRSGFRMESVAHHGKHVIIRTLRP